MTRGDGRNDAVVLTGFGSVDASGCGDEALARTFQGPPRLSQLDTSAGYHRADGSRHAALVDPACMAELLPARQARRMSPPSRFAVVATRIAWQEAGLPFGEPETLQRLGERTAVFTSTAYGPSSYTEELLRQILLGSPTQASPFLFTEAVANAPAAQIALALKARGPNVTVTQREAGPLVALAKAAQEIRSGRADRAVVASVEEGNPLLHAVLDRFGVLAGSRGGAETARPFDRERRGFVLAEGGAAWVLESADAAARRGARIYATLGPMIAGFDPSASPAGYGSGAELLARRLRHGLERHGPGDGGAEWADLDRVDTVVAGASGGRLGDELEAGILRHLWPQKRPTILAPKAYTGEHGGGTLSGLAAVLKGLDAAPSPGFQNRDPDLDIEPFAGGTLRSSGRILVSAPAVGGSVAWLLVEPPGAG